jgi:hypothetical protein
LWSSKVHKILDTTKRNGTIMAVAYQETIALFVDERLLLTYQDDGYGLSEVNNALVVDGKDHKLTIDNLRFWNLDDVEITD